jgi:hypothetical protein
MRCMRSACCARAATAWSSCGGDVCPAKITVAAPARVWAGVRRLEATNRPSLAKPQICDVRHSGTGDRAATLPALTIGGWVMLTITKASFSAMRPMPGDRASRGNLRWTVVGFSAVAIIGLAMNFVASLRAAPSQSGLIAQSELVSQASRVDRSRKGDRITPVLPVIRAALPPGCDAPFSSLAKFSPPNFVGRCLT